ncbi:GspH/FimT family pseudopilin [Hydrogenophaga sp. BPS33]|uniref:GspH/FimT family pseudopilin n=1 Tax=Hydrogenophaga sp. BPS33 TaxID=2651974 RepID=UPI00132038C1|nr:GspH/FimT family pseudopilin [Hydrogenophaga sp. BPS33]QHE88940.1 prepilin-type N-terminal cleavage/methylation domain-containing protein [Hydrogenophaga sp. BPS33]
MPSSRQAVFRLHLRRHSGFTLVELMVVVALVAILAMLALPGWQSLQARNAIRAVVNDYTLSVYFARTEAVRQNAPVTVCPSSTGTACTNSGLESGWVVFVGLADNANPTLLQDTPGRPRVTTTFTDNALASQAVTFLPNGQPAAAFVGNTLRVCPTDAAYNSMSREVTINRSARITVTSPSTCN